MAEIFVNGPEGRIQGRYRPGGRPDSPIVLLLHPHPQYGGTMNNKVVYAMQQAFGSHGFSVLRINFRGVGRSQGTFDNGQGELSDAAAALDWLQNFNPNGAGCWIGGFSFGAWIAMQVLMRRPEIDGFIAISPPANKFDFTFLAPCPSSGLVLHGGSDELVPEPEVARLAAKLAHQREISVEYHAIAGADHFFNNHIDAVTDHVENYLSRHVSAASGS
jgi:hypothetical protein